MTYVDEVTSDSPAIFFFFNEPVGAGVPSPFIGARLFSAVASLGASATGFTGPASGVGGVTGFGQAFDTGQQLSIPTAHTLECWCFSSRWRDTSDEPIGCQFGWSRGAFVSPNIQVRNVTDDGVQPLNTSKIIASPLGGGSITPVYISNGVWTHICLVGTSSVSTLYVNGTSMATGAGGGAFSPLAGLRLLLQNAWVAGPCGIYFSALSSTRIFAHYNAANLTGLVPKQSAASDSASVLSAVQREYKNQP